MNHMHLHQPFHILIKGAHQEIHIVQIIELPTLRDEWVAQQVPERDRVPVQLEREVSDLCELEW